MTRCDPAPKLATESNRKLWAFAPGLRFGDDVQNLSRNFLRGWWPHGSGRLVVFEAIEPTEEEATNERG